MNADFDVVVLGGGPGGYTAAIRAAQLGKSVAVIEAKWWGGVCLNVGCIPTKALVHHAEIAHLVQTQASEYGITGELSVDYGAAWRRSRAVAERMVKGVHFLMKKNHITEFNGWGSFVDAHTLDVRLGDGTSQRISGSHVIIAVGATPKLLPGTAVGTRVWTYEQLIMAEQLPNSIIIGGSGAIGIEFAYVLASYGIEVTLVEYLDRLAPNEDAEISKELGRAFRKLGIKVMTSTRVGTVSEQADRVEVTVTPAAGGESQVLSADVLLQAMGFAPNLTGYGLEHTAVATAGGAITIDERMRTNVTGVFAIGDVTAKLMLAHTAAAQGVAAAETIAGLEPTLIDYRMVPRATYCEPQIASFGYTEAQAAAANLDVSVARFPFSANGKAQGMGQGVGFVKLIADAASHELVGAHLIGPGVTELVPELVLAQHWELRTDEIAHTIHAHPTLSEAIQEAAAGIGGTPINL